MKKVALMIAVAALAVPARVRADDSHDIYSYAWHEHSLKSDIGVSALLGGGISGFTDKAMRDVMSNNVDALWDLRVTIGSHIPLALDIAYVGTSGTINALGGNRSGTLVGTTAEAALRYNILPHFAWDPYAFVGVGWQRYDLSGGTFTVADTGIRDSDNSVVYPMGAGIAYRDKHGLVVDLHGTFRANTNYGLVAQTVGGTSYVPMHMWEASGAVGYEF